MCKNYVPLTRTLANFPQSGEYNMDQSREQYLYCATGFYSWINLRWSGVEWPQPPPTGEMACAYNGLNFKFGVNGR